MDVSAVISSWSQFGGGFLFPLIALVRRGLQMLPPKIPPKSLEWKFRETASVLPKITAHPPGRPLQWCGFQHLLAASPPSPGTYVNILRAKTHTHIHTSKQKRLRIGIAACQVGPQLCHLPPDRKHFQSAAKLRRAAMGFVSGFVRAAFSLPSSRRPQNQLQLSHHANHELSSSFR